MAAPQKVYAGRFNVRVSVELEDLVISAINKSGHTQSEWLRDALEYAANTDLADPEPTRRLLLVSAETGKCVHPRPARVLRGTQKWCLACDTRLVI